MAKVIITEPSPGVRLGKLQQPAESGMLAYGDVSRANNSSMPRQQEPHSYLVHPELPRSHTSLDKTTTSTHWPLYSQDARFLEEMLRDQAKYPPKFSLRLMGTHSKSKSNSSNGTSSSTTVTDFDFCIDMTHFLIPNPSTPHSLSLRELSVVLPNQMAYRGHREKTASTATEVGQDTQSYIRSYVDLSATVRSFTLNRRVADYDQTGLEALIRPLVDSTNYRGRLSVSFPLTQNRVTVYNPCWQNRYRDKTWLRWLCYLSLLWLFTWPYLWSITRRWECVEAIFPYSRWADSGHRFFVTKSEQDFFNEWSLSIRCAVLSKRRGWLDEEYKRQTEASARNGGVVTSAAHAWGW